MTGMPELIFHVEPTKDHRFRYESEFKKGSHGRLKGRQTSENAKAKKNSLCPIVHLRNYTGPEPISLRVTFRTLDGLYQHANKVVMGSSGINAQPGVIKKESTKLPDGTLEWRLDNISICYMGKKELETCLSQHYSTYSQMPGEEKKELENSGVLYAEALRHNEEQPFLSTKSEEIHNTKAMQCLNIDYVDKVAGYVTGNEEVVILCNKISKDLIDTSNLSASQVCVEFYDTKKEWRQFAKLNFIHHQVAIVFETPPYRDLEIDKEVEVWMQLRTKDDDDEDKCSEPKQFTYWPREDGYLARKRKKVDELERQPEYIVSQQVYIGKPLEVSRLSKMDNKQESSNSLAADLSPGDTSNSKLMQKTKPSEPGNEKPKRKKCAEELKLGKTCNSNAVLRMNTSEPGDGKLKRKRFSVNKRLEAIEYAEVHGKNAAARYMKVNPKPIRDWCHLKNKLADAKTLGCKKKFRVGGSRNEAYPGLEDEVMSWIDYERGEKRRVTRRKIVTKAKEFFHNKKSCGFISADSEFNFNNGWLERFLSRRNLLFRKKTTSREKSPA